MHDPMVVAWDIPAPWPRRERFREAHWKGRRWGFTRARRTNPENLGQPVYRWWRPCGWTLAIAGRLYGLGRLATIWHVEPGGHDAFDVCKHSSRWRWHVWHWHLQVHALQSTRARLFDRCELCGRKGRPNISHQWDGPKIGWRKWRSRQGLYHRECSELVSRRRTADEDAYIIRHLVGWLQLEADLDRAELVDRLTGHQSPLPFHHCYHLTRMLGYERDDNYRLVPMGSSDG